MIHRRRHKHDRLTNGRLYSFTHEWAIQHGGGPLLRETHLWLGPFGLHVFHGQDSFRVIPDFHL